MAYSEEEASRARLLRDEMRTWTLEHLVQEREHMASVAQRLEREVESNYFRYRVLNDVLTARVRDSIEPGPSAVRVGDDRVAIISQHGTVEVRSLVHEIGFDSAEVPE